jgi:hypothetical protein
LVAASFSVLSVSSMVTNILVKWLNWIIWFKSLIWIKWLKKLISINSLSCREHFHDGEQNRKKGTLICTDLLIRQSTD